ncbi:hypothetical protein PG997_008838 [Apiospora hydei]|uniref:Uncharacterized protein n=1 Tax=Apiospora hydei TaxID=1337664 RepID=A0ABR1WEX5_9PEZI
MDNNKNPVLPSDEGSMVNDESIDALFEPGDNDFPYDSDADTDADADTDDEAAFDKDANAAFDEVPLNAEHQAPLNADDQVPLNADDTPKQAIQQNDGQGAQVQQRQHLPALTTDELKQLRRGGVTKTFTPLLANMNQSYASYNNWLAIENVAVNQESNDRGFDQYSVDDQALVQRLFVAYHNTTDTFEGKEDGSFTGPIVKALDETSDLDLQMLCWRLLFSFSQHQIYMAQEGKNTLPITYTTRAKGNGEFGSFMARFQAVEFCVQKSKLMCKDMLCGDEYLARLAWNPEKELKRKNQNMEGNMKRNATLACGNKVLANGLCTLRDGKIVANAVLQETDLGAVELPRRSKALGKALEPMPTRSSKTEAAKAHENMGLRRQNTPAGPSKQTPTPRQPRATKTPAPATPSSSASRAPTPAVRPAAPQPAATPAIPAAPTPAPSSSRARSVRQNARSATPKPAAQTPLAPRPAAPATMPAAMPAPSEPPMMQSSESQGFPSPNWMLDLDMLPDFDPSLLTHQPEQGPSLPSLNRPLSGPAPETQGFGTGPSPAEPHVPIDPALQQQMGNPPSLPNATVPVQNAESVVPQFPQTQGSVPSQMTPGPSVQQQQQQQPAASSKSKGKRKASEVPQSETGDQGGSSKRPRGSGSPSVQQNSGASNGEQGSMSQGFNSAQVQGESGFNPGQYPIQGESVNGPNNSQTDFSFFAYPNPQVMQSSFHGMHTYPQGMLPNLQGMNPNPQGMQSHPNNSFHNDPSLMNLSFAGNPNPQGMQLHQNGLPSTDPTPMNDYEASSSDGYLPPQDMFPAAAYQQFNQHGSHPSGQYQHSGQFDGNNTVFSDGNQALVPGSSAASDHVFNIMNNNLNNMNMENMGSPIDFIRGLQYQRRNQ